MRFLHQKPRPEPKSIPLADDPQAEARVRALSLDELARTMEVSIMMLGPAWDEFQLHSAPPEELDAIIRALSALWRELQARGATDE